MAKIATREAYGKALVEFGANNDIVVMDADLSKSTYTAFFQKAYPERHINMGIAEANMMSAAAGIATCGKTVFASTFAIFASERAVEQVRNSICYPNLDVKVCATHAGLSIGEDGASHQIVEDIAIMRSIPNMRVISPCDAVETRLAIQYILDAPGPFYVRLGRLAVESVYEEGQCPFEFGKGIQLREGSDMTIVSTGLMVQESLRAVDILKEKGISARLIDIHTIKPIDRDILAKASRETGLILTAEEHTVYGGLGSAVAESVSQTAPCLMAMVGVQDRFGKSGKPADVLAEYGLTAANIAASAEKLFATKKG